MTFKGKVFAAKATTIKADAGAFHRHLLANERLSPAALGDLHDGLARETVRAAMQDSPYYRRTYGSLGVDARDLTDPEAWASLPILDCATVKTHASEFPTPYATGRNVREARTGGSTGEPLRTMHDARVPSLALSWRMYSWWGVQPFDDLARIGRWNFGRSISTPARSLPSR